MSERMTARKRQALEMRSRIQSAALDLFDREGFENVSVEEIAQTAGCSVGNIYHYFKSKDELAIQVTSHVDDAYSELEEAYLADTARPAREKLLDFVGRSLEISVSDPVRRLSTGCGIRSSGCCRKTPGGYTSGCCWSW
jgi:AcrR family transcriptional regulator